MPVPVWWVGGLPGLLPLAVYSCCMCNLDLPACFLSLSSVVIGVSHFFLLVGVGFGVICVTCVRVGGVLGFPL